MGPASDKDGVSIPEQHLRHIAYSQGKAAASGESEQIGLVGSEPLYAYPVDVGAGKGWFFRGPYHGHYQAMVFSKAHNGLDIGTHRGTHPVSPSRCTVTDLRIDQWGGHAINLDCGSSSQILFGHLDFALHNYDALAWYAVPKSMFFNEDGTKKASVSAAVPQNQSPLRGQDFHVYAACTGKCARLFHAMVGSVL